MNLSSWSMVALMLMTATIVSVCAATEPDVCDKEEGCLPTTEENKYSDLDSRPECAHPPEGLGRIRVTTKSLEISQVGRRVDWLQRGGLWQPHDCKPRQKVAILVPYRDRLDDLKIFLNNIHDFMKTQNSQYGLYLIEQGDDKHFNRGMLLNIGFELSMKETKYDCIILHDVDKFPEDTRNLYTCSKNPTHLIGRQKYVNQNYRERPYDDYFGGVTAISSRHYLKINGFSNMFWGWGSEDDDFLNRMKHHGLKTKRVDDEIGSYVEIWHPYGFVNPRRHEVNADGKNRFKNDGLNSLAYELVHTIREPLYTKFIVTLTPEDPYKDHK